MVKILALILTLSPGGFEVRQEGSFDILTECQAHLTKRAAMLATHRNIFLGCISTHDLEGILSMAFGPRT